MMSEDTNNAISLPASVDGRLPLNGQDGADPSGLAVAHVSRFRARDSEKAMPTNATSGPLFNALSPSATLAWSLESRLRQRMAGNGCPLYDLTSNWDMPAGPQICRQRASARRTSGNDCTGWPTPKHSRAGSRPERNQALERSVGQTNNQGAVTSGLWRNRMCAGLGNVGNKQSPRNGDLRRNLANWRNCRQHAGHGGRSTKRSPGWQKHQQSERGHGTPASDW